MLDYGRYMKEFCAQITLSDDKFYVYISNPARTADSHQLLMMGRGNPRKM